MVGHSAKGSLLIHLNFMTLDLTRFTFQPPGKKVPIKAPPALRGKLIVYVFFFFFCTFWSQTMSDRVDRLANILKALPDR